MALAKVIGGALLIDGSELAGLLEGGSEFGC